jgi:hypothetical protein
MERSQGESYPVAAIGHIETTKPNGPRYNRNLTFDKARELGNLILLCPNCHTMIDSDEDGYSVERLKNIKRIHEERCKEVLREHILDVNHASIKAIADKLDEELEETEEDDFTLLPLKTKIDKNGLSAEIEELLKQGLMRVGQVRTYLESAPEPQDVHKLKVAFIGAYNTLSRNGYEGDDLFHELWAHLSGWSFEEQDRAVGLVMITYFFELCEAFEK